MKNSAERGLMAPAASLEQPGGSKFGGSSSFTATIFSYISAALERRIFLLHSQEPVKQHLVCWGIGKDPQPVVPRGPGPPVSTGWEVVATPAKVGLDHRSLVFIGLWVCMGNEHRPDATLKLFPMIDFFSFSCFKGKNSSLETKRQIMTIKCKFSCIFFF